MSAPCTKQVVVATIVARDGRRFVGRNDVQHPQMACPRGGMPHGVGYEICRDVCGQVGHAEILALAAAGHAARGATLYLSGHDRQCTACAEACREAGIETVVIE